MRLVFLILMLIFSLPLFAHIEIKTQIHDIDLGQKNEVPLVFLSSGQVVSYPDGKQTELDRIKQGLIKRTWFLFRINDKKEIISLSEINPPLAQTEKTLSLLEDTAPYQPSILKNLDEARSFFYDARTNAREESQCFNRAHVWTYEWRTKRNLYASKVWLFFTRRFIRKYKFEWWFHVAPMVHIIHEGVVKERIMDIKYAKGPIKLKQWTDIFIRDNVDCPVVQKYSDHADHPESGSCFIMKSSMYYYQPVDLEQTELTRTPKTRWIEPEVKHAYLDAFEVIL